MSAVFLWLCKAGMILYVFTMLVLTIGYCSVSIYHGASAKIKSEKLSAVAAVGLGLEAQLGKRASLGVSYYGAYGSKIKSNGVGATFKLAF